jgi:hypothetical protein
MMGGGREMVEALFGPRNRLELQGTEAYATVEASFSA